MVCSSLDHGTWTEVEAEAQLTDGHLVSVLDQATNNYLQDLFDSVTPYWIGLSRPTLSSSCTPPSGTRDLTCWTGAHCYCHMELG